MAGPLRGCAIIPAPLEQDVFRVLRVSEDKFPAEMRALQSKLRGAGASVEDLLHFESSIGTFRRLERLELSTISGLDPAARALVESLDARGWRHILDYGEARLRMFAANPGLEKVAIGSVKGIVAEEIFDVSPRFSEVLARAKARGARLGIPAGDVRYVRGTRGITLSERNLKFVNHGELTDGLITGSRTVELSAAQRAERTAERGRYAQWGATKQGALSPIDEDIHILTLKESKSPSNVDQIAADHGTNWLGQMDNDMERILEFSRARAIIGYTKEIDDAYSYLAESLFYGLIFDSKLSPADIVKRVRAALRQIKLRRTATAREFHSPLVCFQR